MMYEDPICTQTPSSRELAEVAESNGEAGQDFGPDAFDLPDFELKSPAESPDTTEFRSEDFDLPEIDISAVNSDLSPEEFDLPVLESPAEHMDAEELLSEDFELPEIRAPVENTDLDIFNPEEFELPDFSSMCPLTFHSHLISSSQAVPMPQNWGVQHYHHSARQSSPNFVPSAPNAHQSVTTVH